MQYFTPAGGVFAGDCMPFFHDGVFHLYYLRDEQHHQALGGLGGHQWAHASTRDLVHWTHHPLAIPITEKREGSICTGSVFYHAGTYYGFYATRTRDRTQHLSLAISRDGILFDKVEPNPLASPPPAYSPYHYRDPVVFGDERTGLFHMLVTTMLTEHPLHERGGCLAHLVSDNLQDWETEPEPFIVPGYLGAPECPDAFEWNGWHYLIFSNDGVARYRMSRDPLGPWTQPRVDTFDGPMARVMKTAAFAGNRRIGAAFLPSVEDDRDDGAWLYAGNVVFREIVQHADGTLGTAFPSELVPACRPPVELPFAAITQGVTREGRSVRASAVGGMAAGAFDHVPPDARVTCTVKARAGAFGLCLRAAGAYERGYELRLSPHEGKVEVRSPLARSIPGDGRHAIFGVEGLDGPVTLDIVMTGDIVDVCIDGRRCLVNRFPEQRGDRLFLFCANGEAVFEDTAIRPLADTNVQRETPNARHSEEGEP